MIQVLMKLSQATTLFEKIQMRNISVLFVCVGNSCRSQMAEAFANAYGSDVLDTSSAGLVPASRLSRTMCQVMAEKQITIETRQPRRLNALDLIGFDLVINLCEYALPNTSAEVIKVAIADPSGHEERRYREVRDRLEEVVESLIAQFRTARGVAPGALRPVLAAAA